MCMWTIIPPQDSIRIMPHLPFQLKKANMTKYTNTSLLYGCAILLSISYKDISELWIGLIWAFQKHVDHNATPSHYNYALAISVQKCPNITISWIWLHLIVAGVFHTPFHTMEKDDNTQLWLDRSYHRYVDHTGTPKPPNCHLGHFSLKTGQNDNNWNMVATECCRNVWFLSIPY